ncbi:FecR family protein [Mucilaginibacter aquatilis]|uniref:DUF4974 domain-containing protein n=1 Tax=Mucilaginibacter aquatilis TaxID=1517760 RepID=A0A6I4IC64_9SPHI|nr:FecR family protein [Mucilaginibacter aquatilis]MVN92870.1 DUF4974 domain-containing protein [Mucilaginibacter aquatilis]
MKITPQLIRKYLNNTCTPEEKEFVDEWYNSFDEHPDPLRFLDEVEQEGLKRSMYNRFTQSVEQKREKGGGSFFSGKLYAVFCAAAGIAALLLLIVKIADTRSTTIDAQPTNLKANVTFKNTGSSILKRILPDRSIVWLNPESAITYPDKFDDHTREVKLTGEAFFEVTKDKAHPFIINSGELITRVWGTSFRVKALKNAPAEVSVVTGKVSVTQSEKGQEVMLVANQRVTLLNHNKMVKHEGKQIENEMRIWKKVSLSFEDAPLSKVFAALNQRFGIRIYTKEANLNALTFTADFTDQSLPAILEMIKESVNAAYLVDDDKTFVFKSNTTL